MGTRMLSSAESPVHQNWKQAVVEAKETDTVFLNQQSRPALRALRTERTAALQPLGAFDFREQLAGVQELYFGGDMEAAIPLSGQVVGRIDAVQPVADVIQSTMTGFYESLGHLQDYASPECLINAPHRSFCWAPISPTSRGRWRTTSGSSEFPIDWRACSFRPCARYWSGSSA